MELGGAGRWAPVSRRSNARSERDQALAPMLPCHLHSAANTIACPCAAAAVIIFFCMALPRTEILLFWSRERRGCGRREEQASGVRGEWAVQPCDCTEKTSRGQKKVR